MIVTVLLVIVVVGIVGMVIALAVRSRADFVRQNQVVPGVDSPAPASWAGARSPEAVLHRRVRDAVGTLRDDDRVGGSGHDTPGSRSAHARIEAEALAIDDRLVAAAALPDPQRAAAIDRCRLLVAALEATVAGLVTRVGSAAGRELLQGTVAEAERRLSALERARAEVERTDGDERGAGSA